MDETQSRNPIVCARCNVPLEYVGAKRFHEGTRWGALGDIGELFVKKERFDVYVCPRCGRVELFVDGIGEELRPGEKKASSTGAPREARARPPRR